MALHQCPQDKQLCFYDVSDFDLGARFPGEQYAIKQWFSVHSNSPK